MDRDESPEHRRDGVFEKSCPQGLGHGPTRADEARAPGRPSRSPRAETRSRRRRNQSPRPRRRIPPRNSLTQPSHRVRPARMQCGCSTGTWLTDRSRAPKTPRSLGSGARCTGSLDAFAPRRSDDPFGAPRRRSTRRRRRAVSALPPRAPHPSRAGRQPLQPRSTGACAGPTRTRHRRDGVNGHPGLRPPPGVDPAVRGRGHGTALLRAAEDDLSGRGRHDVQIGADPPYYLYPGVETTHTAMLCLLERHRYERGESNFNMAVDLETLPPDPGGHELAGAGRARRSGGVDAGALAPLGGRSAARPRDARPSSSSRDGAGLAGFCAYDVNRSGILGPTAVRGDLWGQGMGRPLIIGALHRIRGLGNAAGRGGVGGPDPSLCPRRSHREPGLLRLPAGAAIDPFAAPGTPHLP